MRKNLSHKKTLFTKSKNVLEDVMDISHILNKLEEFEKLKIILLNTQQLALFSFISQELISLDKNKLKEHEMTNLKMFKKDKENLANIIIEFRDKIKFSDEESIDEKLYKLLIKEFK